MELRLPAPAKQAIERLEAAGYEAYAVGGCVRDALLGRTPEDWDITTSARPLELEAVFQNQRTIETGIQHGTVTVLIDGTPLEITTYRVDGTYSDNRRPDQVSFTSSLTEDLARRDFTINAMACNEKAGLVDEFGGREDLQQKVIRCVGDPDTRFHEDALRILRALRFASVLGFSIDPDTAAAIHCNRELIRHVSAERITAELMKFLCGPGVTELLLDYRDVFAVIFPELIPCFDLDQKNVHHRYDVYEHIARSVGAAAPIPEVRLAMLLHDIGKPATMFDGEDGQRHFYGHPKVSADLAKEILSRMRLPSRTQRTVEELVYRHDIPISAEPKILRRRLNQMGPDTLRLLLQVKRADRLAQTEEHAREAGKYDDIEAALDRLLAEQPAYTVKDLAVNGNDLKQLGFTGPAIGAAQNALLERVMDEQLPNEKGALMNYAKENLPHGTGEN